MGPNDGSDDVIRTPLISKILAKKFELAQVGRTLFPHFWVPPDSIRTVRMLFWMPTLPKIHSSVV